MELWNLATKRTVENTDEYRSFLLREIVSKIFPLLINKELYHNNGTLLEKHQFIILDAGKRILKYEKRFPNVDYVNNCDWVYVKKLTNITKINDIELVTLPILDPNDTTVSNSLKYTIMTAVCADITFEI